MSMADKQRHITVHDVAKAFDVPPWLVDSSIRPSRLARLRMVARRAWRKLRETR